jgi:iron complex outermembrane recepter protein
MRRAQVRVSGTAAALGAAAALFAPTALAQAAAEATAASADAPTEIVITARRRNERLLDVPVAATAVGAAEIRQYDLTSVANIKIVAPQITFDRGFTGGGASISMRGVSSASLDAGVEQSVLLDFDGMAISRGRILNDAMFDLKEIDVLKGPQALFYGKNSPGGVVSVRSAGPTGELSGYARAGYEFTARNRSLEAAVGGPVGGGLGFRVALLESKSRGYIENMNKDGVPDTVRANIFPGTIVPPAPEWLGAERKEAARLTLAYFGDGALDATFKLLYSRYRGQGLQSFSEVMGCPAGVTQPRTVGGLVDPTGDCKLDNKSSQGWLSPTIVSNWPQVKSQGNGEPYTKNDTVMPTLTLNYQTEKVKLTSVTGYYDYDYVSQGNADATSYSYFWSYSDEKNKSLYQELRAVSSFDGVFNFAVGGHYERNERTLFVGGANGPVPLDPATGRYNSYDNEQHNKSRAHSLFAQVIAKPSAEWEFAGGARYTRESKELNSFNTYVNPAVAASFLPQGQAVTGTKQESNVSPEATVTWHPSRNTMLYAAYKTGYLAGGYSNPGTLGATTSIRTLSFDAEKAKGVELGVKAALLDQTLTASATAYRYQYTGLPLTSLIALSATQVAFVTQNAANTLSQGIELETSYRPSRALTLRASASYNDAHFDDFAAAQCYTGQTAAQGCIADPVTKASTQSLTGREVYRSPKWILAGGVVYEQALPADYRLTWNADLRHSTGYYSGLNLNPVSYQPGFTTLNAGLRLNAAKDRWSFAVIGRNLTNRHYATLGVDKPGGTGEVFAVAGEPRAVVLQGELKF